MQKSNLEILANKLSRITTNRRRPICTYVLTFSASLIFTSQGLGHANFAGSSSCAILFNQILTSASAPTARGYLRTASWDEVRYAVDSAPSEVLDRAFSQMSRQDLDDLFWKSKTGEVRMTPHEEKMINQLFQMVIDLGEKVFWGPSTNRSASIREALRRFDSDVGSLNSTLEKTEVEVLSRAISEHYRHVPYSNSRWYDPAGRLVSPYYTPVLSILAAGKEIRHQAQIITAIERPIRDALERFHLSDADRTTLQNLLQSTAVKWQEARRDVERLYGRELKPDRPLLGDEIRIRDIARRATQLPDRKTDPVLHAMAERNLDILERIIEIPLSEKTSEHLQIRNTQFRRESDELLSAYFALTHNQMPQSVFYRARIDWSVTVKHEERKERQWVRDVPDAQGQTTRTETNQDYYTNRYTSQYLMSRNDLLPVSYEEIIQNHITPTEHIGRLPALPLAEPRGAHAVSAANGNLSIGSYDTRQVDLILYRSEQMRKIELGFRDQVMFAIGRIRKISDQDYQEILNKPDGAKNLAADLVHEAESLRKTRERLKTYQQSSANDIRRNWADDVEQDFRNRNLAMLKLYDLTIRRTLYLAEQVRRRSPLLTFEYVEPRYAQPLEYLRNANDRNRNIVRNSAIGVGLIGGGAALGVSHPSELMEALGALLNFTPP